MANDKSLYKPNPAAFDRIEEIHIIKAQLLEVVKFDLINLLLQYVDEEELLWLVEEQSLGTQQMWTRTKIIH